jgi:hypothetical protein
MTNPPHVALWLDVLNDCRMTGYFEGDDDFCFAIGEPNDEVNLRFEPSALTRFVELATHMLAVPEPKDPKDSRPILVSPAA